MPFVCAVYVFVFVFSEEPKPDTPAPEVTPEPTVLIINAASRSLVESDFLRLIPKGRHVGRWAGDFTKVVQHVNMSTKEPRGQYFLFFNSREAAEAYKKTMIHMLHCARRVLQSSPLQWETGLDTELLGGPASDDDAREARRFSLYAPFQRADFTIMSVEDLWKATRQGHGIDPATPFHPDEQESRPPLQNDAVPNMLVLHLRDDPKADASRQVVVRLVGSRICLDDMERAIEQDGAERNLADNSVYALQAGAGPISWGEDDLAPREDMWGYSRFVVRFVSAKEARRFAQQWHGRTMVDDRTQRNVVVQATALW
ncbi:hypothetical protein N0V88_003072 [Collariella sp. IMI 366227]|nr:hypothetical protein N0V88_003072 [Collariella sp. IMI 366227]